MIIQQEDRSALVLRDYGVVLERLQERHLETVRVWRNHPEVNRYMVYRGEISPEAQAAWFQRIDPVSDFYFAVLANGQFAGLVDYKHIQWELRRAEGGIFMIPQYRSSDVGMRASLCGLDFAFGTLGLEYFESQVLESNVLAQRYNQALGYVVEKREAETGMVWMRMTRESYLSTTEKLRKLLRRLPLETPDE